MATTTRGIYSVDVSTLNDIVAWTAAMAASVQVALDNLALAEVGGKVFATSAARDSAYTAYVGAGGTMRVGMIAVVGSQTTRYDGTAWQVIGNPAGMLAPWAGPASTPPAGWLTCDGTAINRTTYATLFAAIGTTYGVGDGSTTFALPNMQGRVPVGYNSADSDFNTVGKTGGVKTVAHTHTLSDAGQATIALAASANIVERRVSVTTPWTATLAQAVSAAAVANSSSNGVGAALTGSTDSASPSVVQPYMAMTYIIKT